MGWTEIKDILGNVYAVALAWILAVSFVGFALPTFLNADTLSMMGGVFLTVVVVSLAITATAFCLNHSNRSL